MENGWYRIASGEEIRELERVAMEEQGIPQLLLMEHAAMAVAQEIPQGARVLLLCGGGCNGADALACGRILLRRGCRTDYMIGFSDKPCSEWQAQWSYLQAYMQGSRIFSLIEGTLPSFEEYDFLVDGVFGIGLNRNLTEPISSLFRRINALQRRPRVIGIDVPSGVQATTGAVMGEALRADVTVTFTFQKTGLVLYPGRMYAGEVRVADVGISAGDTYTYEALAEPRDRWLPKRSENGHKGTFGKIMIYAGCESMPGAASLCAKAAYRSGAGLVKVVSHAEALRTLHELVPEAIGQETEAHLAEATGALGYSVLVVGPGLGTAQDAEARLERALAWEGRKVLDADALNLLTRRLDTRTREPEERIDLLNEWLSADCILTPHLLELSRLLAVPKEDLMCRQLAWCERLRERMQCVLVWKDACTVVIGDGRVYLNTTGNDAMATAGSGDVLAGICGAFAAVEKSCYDAACKAVYVHGAVGDLCRAEVGAYATMAGDLADKVGSILS